MHFSANRKASVTHARGFTRVAVLALAVAALIPATSAGAASKTKPKPIAPVCKLVVDPAGDATGTGLAVSSPTSDPNLDVLSGDVASDATSITVVVRLAAYSASDSNAPVGQSFGVSFTVNGKDGVDIEGIVSPTGNVWADGKGSGVVDAAHKEVRITVPISALSVAIPKNAVFSGLLASTGRYIGSSVIVGVVDTATSDKTYVAGRPSCVKVGA